MSICPKTQRGSNTSEGGSTMRAAIYCRVSTEDQEKEGTSLDSQREACLAKAREPGYEVADDFVLSETYSGLTLDRPKLSQLRQWVKDKEVDAVIAYTLDRLSRDPVHFIILQEELEKSGVELVLVTETVDSSDLGKLITYIKGYAAKLEAEKIRERTMRGIRERVKAGKMPSGRRARLYGYTYLPGKGPGEGVRYVNEVEARWVKQIFHWFVNDGLGIDRIAYKLRELDIPTPSGKGLWYPSEIWKILNNRAYVGETYVFTQTYVEPTIRLSKDNKSKKTHLMRKPREEWVEIPGATPPIIDRDLFELAQAQLARNRDKASRNMKQQYLLSGHIRCRRCNRNYWGYVKQAKWAGEYHAKRYYRCSGNLQMISPVRCGNHNLNAEKIESLVWQEIDELLCQPRLVLQELQRKRNETNQESLLEQELSQVSQRLRALDREQGQLLQWALKGFPEETVVRENNKINNHRANLKKRKTELEERVQQAKQSEADIAGIERFCELAKHNLKDFSFDDKRLALEALQIEVWVDGDKVSVLGSIPIIEDDIVSTPRWWER
jgi:site-specific DNA recombinase